MVKASYDLENVQALASEYLHGSRRLIDFTAPSRSTESVARTLRVDIGEAGTIIANGFMALRSSDFSGSHLQWDVVCDVYGLKGYQDQNWYVKFCLYDDDGVEKIESISFHPLERDLKLANGDVLKVTSIERGKNDGTA